MISHMGVEGWVAFKDEVRALKSFKNGIGDRDVISFNGPKSIMSHIISTVTTCSVMKRCPPSLPLMCQNR